MSNESTALAVVQPREFTERQLAIITNQIAKGASEDELAYFLEVCRLTGLNPIQRQIYAVMRNSREQVDGEWKTAKRMTIQTGIDGYRLIAARTGQLAGIDDPTYDTEDDEHPNRASVTVWRFVSGHRVPFTATARWREYVQEKDEYKGREKTGKKVPTEMWAKMPYLMLGKCAEALALRKAFPAELSGVYTGEEMSQADHETSDAGYVEDRGHDHELPHRWTEDEKRALFPRWQALQPDQPGMRRAERYNGRWRQMFGHGAPFSDAERDTFAAWIERGERRHATESAPIAFVVEDNREAGSEETLTPDPEQPHDLRTVETDGIGA